MTWAEGWKKTAEAERERADRAEARVADLEETVEALGVSLCDGSDGMLEQERRIAALELALRKACDALDRPADAEQAEAREYALAVLDKREP